jgi:hypothetical protein
MSAEPKKLTQAQASAKDIVFFIDEMEEKIKQLESEKKELQDEVDEHECSDTLNDFMPAESLLDEQKRNIFGRLYNNISLEQAEKLEIHFKSKNKNYIDLDPE